MIVPLSVLAELRHVAQAGDAPSLALARIAGPEIAIVAIVFSTAAAILVPLVRAAAKLEVERISEGQRFVTQLLSNPDTPRLSRGPDA